MSSDISKKISAMRQGGEILGYIKRQLQLATSQGTTFEAIEAQAQQLIKKHGAKPSFSTVEGYHWATCIMKNDALCHGIPKNGVVNDGDVLTIDVGLIYEGYHLDTTVSFAVGAVSPKISKFLAEGETILYKSIKKAQAGATVYDVSRIIESDLTRKGYGAVFQLTGHGIGHQLHMEPSIPCVAVRKDKKQRFTTGQTVAIEIMYTMGKPNLKIDDDGWTFRTIDGSISAMFEETVLIQDGQPEILTLARSKI